MIFKKCSKFHRCILRGFDFIETVYELFDNPSYLNNLMATSFVLLNPVSVKQPMSSLCSLECAKYNTLSTTLWSIEDFRVNFFSCISLTGGYISRNRFSNVELKRTYVSNIRKCLSLWEENNYSSSWLRILNTFPESIWKSCSAVLVAPIQQISENVSWFSLWLMIDWFNN